MLRPVQPETCPRCGEPLPPRAKFCPNCGTPVGIEPASERRVVTVVFVDLAGSTELAARLDPERFREVLAAFHGMVSDQVVSLGGRAEAFIGDAVLGVFGVPTVHDDDALRGIRAGLAIVQQAERLGPRLGLPLPIRVRVGVNTGQVAVGTAADRNLVIGAEVNVGARLQQAAAPGEILAGDTTHILAGTTVQFGEMRLIAAKGFEEELPAWPVLGLAAGASRKQVTLVNRLRELALLSDTFERVEQHERAHLVTLLGEPGIGKSRVVEEFLAGLTEDVKVLIGRSSPFEEEFTFWPLAQIVYRELGEEHDAPQDRLLHGLDSAVRAWVEPEEVEQASRRLGYALGLGEEGSEENRYHAAEVRSGVLSMMTGLARSGPVVLVFEDLQDADPLLLDLIEQLVREARRVPLMVVCVARWEFLERRPSWAGGLADAVTLWVEPLTPAHAAQLAIEAGDLPHEDAERVAQHAGGNPFFIIEITGMLRREERGLPARAWGPTTVRLLPPTVQAVVAARIDQLSPDARDLVRRASVFPSGRFDLDELSLVVDPRKELLEEAEEDELLIPDGERPDVWRFGSDVLRDVAYDSLAKRERQRLHLRVANKLSEPEVADRYPRTIAYHLERAALASLDLDPRDRTLAERALEALVDAGDQARRGVESRSAADLYERALALAGPANGWGEREAWILAMLGEARYWVGEFDLSEDALQQALDIAGATSDRICADASRYLADITLTIRGNPTRAAELFESAVQAARRLGDPHTLSRSLLMAAWVPFWRNELDVAEAMFREALEVSRADGRADAWAQSRALVGIANVISQTGSEEEALAIGLEALSLGEEAGQGFTSAVAHETVAASLRRLMRLEEALGHAELAVGALRELGARWELASALGDRGAIQRLAGRLEGAEADMREAFVLCRDLKERALVTWTAAELAKVLAFRGDASGARQVLSDPAARIAAGEPGSATALLNAESVVALAEGDPETARTKAVASIEAERGPGGVPNALAAQIWWTSQLFGDEAAGGPDAAQQARDLLERHAWLQALREPEMAADLKG
jgi:class 3 adenylate cyclase/tetratricopeptide (TPR) repeat protein